MWFKGMRHNALYWIIGLSSVGLIDALYLSYARYMGVTVPCSVTEGGCAIVAASPYAVVFGIPLAYLGVMFYAITIALAVLYKKYANFYLQYALIATIVFGAIDSLYFMYLQAFVIGAFCIYCIISAIITWLLLVFAMILHIRHKRL